MVVTETQNTNGAEWIESLKLICSSFCFSFINKVSDTNVFVVPHCCLPYLLNVFAGIPHYKSGETVGVIVIYSFSLH